MYKYINIGHNRITLSTTSSLILGENKDGFPRKSHKLKPRHCEPGNSLTGYTISQQPPFLSAETASSSGKKELPIALVFGYVTFLGKRLGLVEGNMMLNIGDERRRQWGGRLWDPSYRWAEHRTNHQLLSAER